MPYIVKWIPKDLDIPVDHSTHYDHLEQAVEFSRRILVLEPKRIWIEDDKGLIQLDHDKIVSPQNDGES